MESFKEQLENNAPVITLSREELQKALRTTYTAGQIDGLRQAGELIHKSHDVLVAQFQPKEEKKND